MQKCLNYGEKRTLVVNVKFTTLRNPVRLSTMIKNEIQILGLTKKEERVVQMLVKGITSPTSIGREAKVSRVGVYKIIASLEERGIVKQVKKNNKKYFELIEKKSLLESLQKTEKFLSKRGDKDDPEETVYGTSGDVSIFMGKKGLEKVFDIIFTEYSNQEFLTLQTKKSDMAWLTMFSAEEVKKYSHLASKSRLIHRNMFEKGMIKLVFEVYGLEWAKSYVGRTASVNEIDPKYTDFSSQIWLSASSFYLVSVEEKIAIVIKNKIIIKMMRSLLKLIHDNSHKIDINEELRKLMKD